MNKKGFGFIFFIILLIIIFVMFSSDLKTGSLFTNTYRLGETQINKYSNGELFIPFSGSYNADNPTTAWIEILDYSVSLSNEDCKNLGWDYRYSDYSISDFPTACYIPSNINFENYNNEIIINSISSSTCSNRGGHILNVNSYLKDDLINSGIFINVDGCSAYPGPSLGLISVEGVLIVDYSSTVSNDFPINDRDSDKHLNWFELFIIKINNFFNNLFNGGN